MSWLLTVNQLAHEIEEKKSHEVAKKQRGEMSALRGKLLQIFGDDAADIIDNGQADIENVAYRNTNFEFQNVGGLCGSSIRMAFYVMVGTVEERIVYNTYVEDLEDAARGYEYLHAQADKLSRAHTEKMIRKDKERTERATSMEVTLNLLQTQTLNAMRRAIRAVEATGQNPGDTSEDAIYAFAKNLVSIDLAFGSVATDYGDDHNN